MNREQLQYACDLVNRNNERTDAAQMKCKVGKPCNGRCIPQSHKCGGETENSAQSADKPQGSFLKKNLGKVALLGASAAAGGLVAANLTKISSLIGNDQSKTPAEKAKKKEWDQKEAEFQQVSKAYKAGKASREELQSAADKKFKAADAYLGIKNDT